MDKTTNKIKHLWHSNAPHTNSGYAVETRDLLFRFLKKGFDFDCVGFYGVDSYPIYSHGEDLIDSRFKDVKLKVFPKMNEPYGGDALVAHVQATGAKTAFVMLDLFSIAPQYFEQLGKMGVKFIPYLPIDQEPINPLIINNLRYAYKIVTFSKFGQEALAKEGFASHMIYEGIDTSIFKPMDKMAMREKIGLPKDQFIFGMIAANKENPPRKSFQEVLEAFAKFNKVHPNSSIFFHTQQISPGGFPIRDYANYLGIVNKTYFMDQYAASFATDSKKVAEIINCFDVYLNPSMTEGFGMGMVESQSCGVPVIGNRCHSMPELIIEGKTGFVSETGKPYWRNLNGYVYPPDVDSLASKMEDAFNLAQKGSTAKACRQNVLDNYDVDKIVEKQWEPFLKDLEEEIASESIK